MMLKQIAAVGVGFTVWSTAWLFSTTMLVEFHVIPHNSDTPIHDPSALLGLLIGAIFTSMVAGYATAIFHPSSIRPVLCLGLLLVLMGAIVQNQIFDQMPLWYHVAFLTLLLPICLVGARLR
jgi:hypothetical protein